MVYQEMEVKGSLGKIFAHLESKNEIKRDYVSPSGNILYGADGKILMFDSDKGGITELQLNGYARTQMLQKLGIPIEYANRCTDALLKENVNGWLKQMPEKSFMLRTFDEKDGGVCRAFLSNRYKVIDNFEMFQMILGVVENAQKETGYQILAKENSVTDSNMYLRFIAPQIEEHSKIMEAYKNPQDGNQNTGIATGFIFKNSETGGGKFSIAPRIVFGACSNGAIFAKESISMVHLGGHMEDGLFSNQTLSLQMEGVMSGAKDCLKKWLSKDWLGQKISLLEDAGNIKLKNPVETVMNTAEHLKFSKEKTLSLINSFTLGGDSSALGVFHAITHHAQHEASEDDRFALEAKATDILSQIKGFDRPVTNRKKMFSFIEN